MAPNNAVVTAKIPVELRERLDSFATETRKRNQLIGEAIELWCDHEEGAVEVEAAEVHTGQEQVAELRATIDDLRRQLTERPAARSRDADHVAPPVPTKRRKQLWATLKTFQSTKIGGQTAADVLGALELASGKRLPQNGVAKRVSELHQGGYITDDPRKAADPDGAWAAAKDDRHTPATKDGQPTGAYVRPTTFGRPATVYWVTPAGVEHYNNPPKA